MPLFRKKKPNVSHRPRVYSGKEDQKNSVFSYYAHRSQTPAPAGRSKAVETVGRHHVQWHHVPTAIAGLAIIISVGYLMTVNTNPKVNFISTNGSTSSLLRDQRVYQQAAAHFLSSSLVDHIKITINTADFANNMKRQFPELSDVSVTLPLMGRRPIVELAAATPALILASQKGTYLIADDGRAILPLSETHGLDGLNLPKVGDQNSADISLGRGALPSDEVAFIQEITGQLKAKSMSTDSLTLPALADELDVQVKGLPYFIKFNIQADPRQSAGAFLAAKQHLDSQHIIPSQYIDVRVEEKAYYK